MHKDWIEGITLARLENGLYSDIKTPIGDNVMTQWGPRKVIDWENFYRNPEPPEPRTSWGELI